MELSTLPIALKSSTSLSFFKRNLLVYQLKKVSTVTCLSVPCSFCETFPVIYTNYFNC